MSVVLVVVSILGILTLSFAFPLLGILLQKTPKRHKTSPKSNSFDTPIALAVIIPAHNEARNIAATLESIRRAHNFVDSKGLKLQIYVGADGCSDQTAKISSDFGASVIEQSQRVGKWLTLKNLFKHTKNPSTPQWMALVDAGSVWPEDLLANICDNLLDESLIGIAPSYRNRNAGLIEKISWSIEKILKTLENFAGGPVSVHGATVLYRSETLEEAFDFLDTSNWTNDDVVIPLAIRSLNKDRKIIYRNDLNVLDEGATSDKHEGQRRTRLINGNLQWISSLWIKSFALNPVAGILALRRISRVFWAYWLAASVAATSAYLLSNFAYTSEILLLVSAVFLISSSILFCRSKSLLAIVSVSLLSPIHFLFFARKESVWK